MEQVGGGRRRSLLDEMSALPEQRNTLAGLTLDAVLSDRRGGGNSNSRTLFDIIRDDPTTKSIYPPKDRKSWRLLRDKLRLKRAGAAWTSSVRVPASDLPIHAPNTRRVSLMSSSDNNSSPGGSAPETRPMFMRRSSTRFAAANHDEAADVSRPGEVPPSRSFKPQSSRHNSPRMANRDGDEINPDPFDVARDGTRRLSVVLADERAMSAREAVAAQEAAEAAAKAELVASPAEATEEEEGGGGGASEDLGGEAASSSGGGQPVRMSLMDLLEETDREMGVEGSRYMIGDDDDEEFDDEEEEEEDEGVENGGIEYNCCVCMVRHKGAAFIPCGHTFCRLCSRELWVQRGNCPLCNNYIVEILDIF